MLYIFPIMFYGSQEIFIGLCRGSRLDTKYSWTRESAHGFYSLNGYKDAVLSKDIEENNWKIALYTTNETFAIANTTDYPFGFQQWTINNDPCFGQGEVTTILGLNACLASDFNCADGQCIPMESRCDGILNCHDKSGKYASVKDHTKIGAKYFHR